MIRALVAAALFATALPAGACLMFSNYKAFAPDAPESYDWDGAPLNPLLPAPQVRVLKVTRAPREPADYAGRIMGCTMGQALLQVRWPAAGGPPLKEVGFRFKKLKDGAIFFDEGPQQGAIRGRTMAYEFSVFESAEAAAAALDMEIEVYAVNADRERGPGTRLHIHAPPAPGP